MKRHPNTRPVKESVHHRILLAASPEDIYDAWLDSDKHSAMTGGEAECSKETGEKFSAWDGYISGTNLELEPGRRILQSWRTSEFDDADEDSFLELIFRPSGNGTELTLNHTNIPEGQTQYEQGWVDSYFEPMRHFFQ